MFFREGVFSTNSFWWVKLKKNLEKLLKKCRDKWFACGMLPQKASVAGEARRLQMSCHPYPAEP